MSDARIRIHHIITRLIVGGAQENTILTCAGLQATGRYDVTLVTGPAPGAEGDLFDRARELRIRVVLLPTLVRSVDPFRDSRALLSLIRILHREQPRIVHTHSAKAGILGRIAARICGVPHIVHTIHGLPFHEHQAAVLRGLARIVEQLAGSVTDQTIAVGEVMKEKALAARLARTVEVIYSGIETSHFTETPAAEARRRLDLPQKVPVVVAVSRLSPLKGHEDLLKAIAMLKPRHPGLLLYLVGDGTLRSSLEGRARELGIDVRFAGRVDPREIPLHLSTADLLAHASYREGLPRCIPQALLIGRPVAAYDCDGARECVIEGVTGRLAPTGNVEALAQAIDSLLRLPDRGRSLGEEGRRRFSERFRVERMVGEIDRLYRGLEPDAS